MVVYLPSTASRSITVLAPDVGTTLSVSAPSSVAKGATFSISGILIRNDTGFPIPNAPISIRYNGNSIGSRTTGVDGDYLITGSIPFDGTFTLTASFAGMTVAGLTFGASYATRGIGTLVEPSILPIVMAGIFAYLILKR